MDPIEAAAFVLGVINVTLVVRRSIWNFPAALAMVSLYAGVFARERLYSDMVLQGFFFAVNLYGWAMWTRAKAETGEVAVATMPGRQRGWWFAGGLVATGVWGAGMHALTDAAVPWWDAANAVASVVAQVLLARRYWENWAIWIAVDVSSIALFASRGLMLTALLYGVFLALSVWGLVDWRRRR